MGRGSGPARIRRRATTLASWGWRGRGGDGLKVQEEESDSSLPLPSPLPPPHCLTAKERALTPGNKTVEWRNAYTSDAREYNTSRDTYTGALPPSLPPPFSRSLRGGDGDGGTVRLFPALFGET